MLSDGETSSFVCRAADGIFIDEAIGGGTAMEVLEVKFVADALDELKTELILLSWL